MSFAGPFQPETCCDSVILCVLQPQVVVPCPRGVPAALAYQRVSRVKQGSLLSGWPCAGKEGSSCHGQRGVCRSGLQICCDLLLKHRRCYQFLSAQESNLKVNQKHLFKGNSHFTAASILLCSKSDSSREIMTGKGRSRATTEMTNYVLWHSEMASGWLSEGTDRLCATVSSLCPLFTDGKLTRREIAALINAVKDLCQEMGCLHHVGSHGVEALSSFKQLLKHDLS